MKTSQKSPSKLLWGQSLPEDDLQATAFLLGERPERADWQAFYDCLVEGRACPEQPARLGQLCRLLLDWEAALEAADRGGPLPDRSFWSQCPVHEYPLLRAWFERNCGFQVGLEGGDPTRHYQASLRASVELKQWGQLQRLRRLLSTEEQPEQASQDRETEDFLRSVTELTATSSPEPMRRQFLSWVLDKLPLEGCVWLEPEGTEWVVCDHLPVGSYARYSRSLVSECWRRQELLWGSPEQLSASRSLLLSDVRTLLAVPVGDGVLFGWQTALQVQEHWLAAHHLSLLEFMRQVAGVVLSNLKHAEELRQLEQQAAIQEQRWRSLFEGVTSLGLAELTAEGLLIRCNQAFLSIFPEARIGCACWSWLPDSEREADRLRWQTGPLNARWELCLTRNEKPRWYQVVDWMAPGMAGVFRGIFDGSESEVLQCLQSLQEMRQQTASDLHDGPAQQAAAGALAGDGQSRQRVAALRQTLLELRSPWLEGLDPSQWLEQMVGPLCPHSRIELIGKLTDLEPAMQRVVLSGLGPLLRDLTGRTVTIRLERDALEVNWRPATHWRGRTEDERVWAMQLSLLGWGEKRCSGQLRLERQP